ncbi:methyl-accepting chemotaxis protein [Methylobacter sp.]|uniref:methyl-accepting chemotaxis protein n=1 Tax=Methylobacter sp. TaxID=2051955 RepID=UPI002FDCAC5B
MNDQEDLLKPIRAQVDGVMMATVAFVFLVTVVVGWVYDGIVLSLVIGLPALIVPFLIWRSMPGTLISRLAMASALVIQIAIQIQVSHGLIEMHFGLFVVLAFLLAYRDWRPIVFAAGLIAVHHLACNFLQAAQMDVWVFQNGPNFGIVLLHATYVIFESVILVYLAVQLRFDGIELVTFELLADRIASGDLSTEMDVRQEKGMLHSMKTMQDVINNFVTAQSVMAHKHAEGCIFEQLDDARFPGTYGKMAKEINELVASHVAEKMQVVDIVSQYAKGDFSRDMDQLPGEKAKVTAAVDAVKTALLGISNEIKAIVGAGVQGDFTYRVQADNFEFLFKEILTDLNTLIETCDSGFSDIERVATALAQGDLSQSISQNYPGTFGQVKEAVNGTVENFKNTIGGIKDSVDTISDAAKEIAAGNNDLSHRTEEQAASLEQTAASMEELTSTVQQNSENAKHASRLATSASDVAGKGVAAVSEVVTTMEGINQASSKIVDIISVIDSIAFQTNILALNAAVEAARAGEQGRGFAVVAVEVRNLAQRASAAAGEIKNLIGDSVEKVEDGTKLVARAGKTMEEIVSAIRGVTAIMSEISAASVEQTSGIQQVNQAISQMDDVTQQNAALVEQAAAAAESLEEQTGHLSNTIAGFKLHGGAHVSTGHVNTGLAVASSQSNKKNVLVRSSSYKNIPVSNETGIDLDKALEKHSDWKVKLRTAISKREAMDAAMISKDDCCDFGKWLHGEAKSKLGHRASYSECVSKHAAFHVEAGKVATMINAKKFTEAEKMLGNGASFVSASTAVGVAIMRLKKDISAPTSTVVAKPKVQVAKANADEWEEF